VVLLVGLSSHQGGKLERPIKPTTCAPADLEAAMDYGGNATGSGDCRRVVDHTSVAPCGNWARTYPPKAVIRSRLLRVEPGHTDKTACETAANASERPRTYCSALQAANHWLALASIGGRVERAMGIENSARRKESH
jgi:hypothetical protein